jgi:Phage tail lysozyme
LGEGASGTIGGAECSTHPLLDEVTFLNEGSVTFGEAGGTGSGAITMTNGAQVDNAGTFDDYSYDPGCGYESTGYSFYDPVERAASAINNTGTFLVETGTEPTRINVNMTTGGTLTIPRGEELESQASFTIDGGSVNATGLLDAAGTLETSGSATINGPGTLLVASEASGTIGGGCSNLVLNGVSFVNDGSLSSTAGDVGMSDGAHLENAGSFDDEDPGCAFGANDDSFYDAGGAAPTITSTGVFEGGSMYGTVAVGVPFDLPSGTFTVLEGELELLSSFTVTGSPTINGTGGGDSGIVNAGDFLVETPGTLDVGAGFSNDGHVEVQAGRLELSAGGISERRATGSWSASGGPIALTGGEFLFVKEVDLSVVREEGAVVEQELWDHQPATVGGSAEEGQTLTANLEYTGTYAPELRSPGGLTGQPTSITYQWEECDGEEPGEVVGTECEVLEGATGSTYELEEEEVGYTMRVTVTARNQLGTTTTTSEPTPVIEEPAFEVPEGEGEEEEFGGGPLVSRLTALAYPSGEIRSHPELLRNAEALYKDLAYFTYEVPNKHKEPYLFRKQIAGIMGNLVYESEYTLSPSKVQTGCTGEECGIGIAQWTKNKRWLHVEEVGSEHPIRGKHGHLENGKYTLYVQALMIWDELKGRWEHLYAEALEALEREDSEKPRGVTVTHATVTFTETFERLTESTVGEPEWHEHLENVIPAAKEVFELSAKW